MTVSYDRPRTQELAHRTKSRYMAQYARPGSEAAGTSCTLRTNVKAMAQALDHHHLHEARKEYVHRRQSS